MIFRIVPRNEKLSIFFSYRHNFAKLCWILYLCIYIFHIDCYTVFSFLILYTNYKRNFYLHLILFPTRSISQISRSNGQMLLTRERNVFNFFESIALINKNSRRREKERERLNAKRKRVGRPFDNRLVSASLSLSFPPSLSPFILAPSFHSKAYQMERHRATPFFFLFFARHRFHFLESLHLL